MPAWLCRVSARFEIGVLELTKVTDEKTAADQRRECNTHCARAMTALAVANEIFQCRQDLAPSLLKTITEAKAQLDAAHAMAVEFDAMLQPITGRA